jgi:hypothetical protein
LQVCHQQHVGLPHERIGEINVPGRFLGDHQRQQRIHRSQAYGRVEHALLGSQPRRARRQQRVEPADQVVLKCARGRAKRCVGRRLGGLVSR